MNSNKKQGSVYTLKYCPKCIQMTNHIGDDCLKCTNPNPIPTTPSPSKEVKLDKFKSIIANTTPERREEISQMMDEKEAEVRANPQDKAIRNFIGYKVEYDKDGQYFWGIDEQGGRHMIAELRGWGAIQNCFKDSKGYVDTDSAAMFQDDIGNWIANAINTALNQL